MDQDTERIPQMCQPRMLQIPFEMTGFRGSAYSVVPGRGVYAVAGPADGDQYMFVWSDLGTHSLPVADLGTLDIDSPSIWITPEQSKAAGCLLDSTYKRYRFYVGPVDRERSITGSGDTNSLRGGYRIGVLEQRHRRE